MPLEWSAPPSSPCQQREGIWQTETETYQELSEISGVSGEVEQPCNAVNRKASWLYLCELCLIIIAQ